MVDTTRLISDQSQSYNLGHELQDFNNTSLHITVQFSFAWIIKARFITSIKNQTLS